MVNWEVAGGCGLFATFLWERAEGKQMPSGKQLPLIFTFEGKKFKNR